MIPAVIRPSRAAVLGLFAGLIGGLFGVGGGLVVVPGLVLWVGMDQHRAHATSVAAIVASASAALTPFAVGGDVDWDTSLVLFLGAGVGAFAGAKAIARVSQVWLARAFVVLIVVAAVRLLVES
jgi:hypothetical protein